MSHIRRVVLIALAVPVLMAAFSFVRGAVFVQSGEPFAQRAVAWARDHQLGGVVDTVESRVYDSPPSKKAVVELGLVHQPQVSIPEASTRDGLAVELATSDLPAPIAPRVQPALDGEGEWFSSGTAAGETVLWFSSIRPLVAEPGVLASMALFDPRRLHAQLYNGTDLPGDLQRFTVHNEVPKLLRPHLVAAFNGGFRFEHAPGSGYFTEGVTVRPLSKGKATMAISSDGVLRLGSWGAEIDPASEWVSLRQNLDPMVVEGSSTVSSKNAWEYGGDYGREFYVVRSAVCTLKDGMMMYVTAGKLDAARFADVLVSLGCRYAMQLDVNGDWPVFCTYRPGALGVGGSVDGSPVVLDRRSARSARRFTNRSSKDFIALFDPISISGDPLAAELLPSPATRR